MQRDAFTSNSKLRQQAQHFLTRVHIAWYVSIKLSYIEINNALTCYNCENE